MSVGFQVVRGVAIGLNILMAVYQLWLFMLVLTTEPNAVFWLFDRYGLMYLWMTATPTLAVVALVFAPRVLKK